MSWGLVDIFYPGETARAEELDRRNAELNAQRRSMGIVTQEQTDAQEARFNDNPEANNAALSQSRRVNAADMRNLRVS